MRRVYGLLLSRWRGAKRAAERLLEGKCMAAVRRGARGGRDPVSRQVAWRDFV